MEDVAKTSLRELLHSKQMQEAKAHQQHMSAFANATGSNSRGTSRSSSPSVNLKTLLETQSREASKGPASSSAMGFTPVYPKYGQSPMAGGGRYNASVPTGQAPLIYPHVFNRSSSPPAQSARGPEGASTSSMFLSSFQSQMPAGAANGGGSGSFKHKKLLEWSANDVRDWVSTLSYCSEFADVRHSISSAHFQSGNLIGLFFCLIGIRAAIGGRSGVDAAQRNPSHEKLSNEIRCVCADDE